MPTSARPDALKRQALALIAVGSGGSAATLGLVLGSNDVLTRVLGFVGLVGALDFVVIGIYRLGKAHGRG